MSKIRKVGGMPRSARSALVRESSMVRTGKSSAVRRDRLGSVLLCNASIKGVRTHGFCARDHVRYFNGKLACNIAGRRFWPLPPDRFASAPFLESARRVHEFFPKMLDRDCRRRGRVVDDRARPCAGAGQAAQHRRHHRRRHRHVEYRRISPRTTAGWTPNFDRIAKEGMLFTDDYAEASRTAGRGANFITGNVAIRTGMTTCRPGRVLRSGCRGSDNHLDGT